MAMSVFFQDENRTSFFFFFSHISSRLFDVSVFFPEKKSNRFLDLFISMKKKNSFRWKSSSETRWKADVNLHNEQDLLIPNDINPTCFQATAEKPSRDLLLRLLLFTTKRIETDWIEKRNKYPNKSIYSSNRISKEYIQHRTGLTQVIHAKDLQVEMREEKPHVWHERNIGRSISGKYSK